MKISEAIEKALEENPNVAHCGVVAFEQIDADNCKACAIGLALIGKLGLEKVLELRDRYVDLYRVFEHEFNTKPSDIYFLNDRIIDFKNIYATPEETKEVINAIKEYEQKV